jgi:hypothetical protein
MNEVKDTEIINTPDKSAGVSTCPVSRQSLWGRKGPWLPPAQVDTGRAGIFISFRSPESPESKSGSLYETVEKQSMKIVEIHTDIDAACAIRSENDRSRVGDRFRAVCMK